MLTTSEETNSYRYNKLANDLNQEAYFQQMRDYIHKPLKHFYPCQKALVLTKAIGIRPIPVTTEVILEAGSTQCQCHPSMDHKQLFKLLLAIEPPQG